MGEEIIKVSDFIVESVPRSAIQKFVEKWHYSHSTNGVQHTQCFALFDGITMIGAMIYALPSMKATAAKYNPINPLRCWELRRLCCIDDTPTNTESYFLGSSMRWLKKNTDYQVIVSYADPEYGHGGTIYKASNFIHYGMSGTDKILIVDGKKYHRRTLRKDAPYAEEIRKRLENKDPDIIWKKTCEKHIYIYYLDKKLKRQYDKNL